MEEKKKCRICGEVKPLSRFDAAPSCSDGHRNVCRDCRRQQMQKRLELNRIDPKFVERERKSGREKYRKYKEIGTWRESKTKKGLNVSIQLKRRGFDMSGKEAHHWNYNFPKSVFILDKKAHRLLHQYMYVDYNTNLCYTKDGVLLESPEQAKSFFERILEENGMKTPIQYVDYSNTITIKQKELWKLQGKS